MIFLEFNQKCSYQLLCYFIKVCLWGLNTQFPIKQKNLNIQVYLQNKHFLTKQAIGLVNTTVIICLPTLMISAYYHRQYSLQRKNNKSIKLKTNQPVLERFIIPEDHFYPNSTYYHQIKDKCEKIKNQFSFIRTQIQREHKSKKEKRQQSMKLAKTLMNQQNRDQIQKQMTLNYRKLLKLQQLRKQNIGQRKNKQIRRFKPETLEEIKGQPICLSSRNYSADKSNPRRIMKPPPSLIRMSMDNQ